MPFILIALIVIGVLLIPKTALAYVGGQPVTINVKSIGDYGCVLRSDAAEAWLEMKSDAQADGVTLKPKGPRSAFRTHEDQVAMTVGEATADYAAPVDHSPHQAGIAVDVDMTGSPDPIAWMNANAWAYDFYPLKGSGAEKEPWHWEYHPTNSNQAA